VQIYYIGDDLDSAFSSEYCGGPHVTHTGEIGRVRITKQEKTGAGVMRVYLVLGESAKKSSN
jgi:alanyl-tRNA synthetase